MGTKRLYPPHLISPGQTTRLTANDGVIEFVGVHNQNTIRFLVAFMKWKQLTEAPMQASTASIEAAARERDRAWNQLDKYTIKVIMEKMESGEIWIPEGEDDNG